MSLLLSQSLTLSNIFIVSANVPRRLRKGMGTVTNTDLEDAAAATKERERTERSREGGWTMNGAVVT